MSALVRLYPRAWRERYEAEFIGLLEARPPSLPDRMDILRGALDARLHPEVPGSTRGSTESQPARRLAIVAMVAGALWLAWMATLLLLFEGWDSAVAPDYGLLAATPLFAGLAMGVAHAAVAVAGGAIMRPGAVLVASLVAVGFWIATFGVGVVLLFALVGSAIVAVDGIGRALAPWLRLVWIIAVASAIVAMLAFIAGGGRDVALLVGAVPYGVVWLLIGVTIAGRGLPVPADAPDPAAASTDSVR